MKKKDRGWDDIQEPENMEELGEAEVKAAEETAEDFGEELLFAENGEDISDDGSAEAEKTADPDMSSGAGDDGITLSFGEDAEEEPQEEKISEAAVYVNKVKQTLQDYQDAQKQKTRLVNEVKQCEKAVAGNEKVVADTIASAIKKRKEEIAASYDKELSDIQDNIDGTKAERQKAKTNAIAARIQTETAPISQENQELEGQIEQKYKENKVPVICRSPLVSGIFFPAGLKDWITAAIAAVFFIFLLPLFIILGMEGHPLGLAVILSIYLFAIFGIYLYLLHHVMLKNRPINEQVNEIRKTIRSNNKSKQAISSRIKKSQDESLYHLEEFDDEIVRLQGQMEETVNQRQAALDLFESDVRHQITAEITAEKKEESDAVEQRLEDARKAQMTLDNEITSMETTIREEYEPLFGQDLLHRNKLDSLAQFCEEHADLSVEEAISQYRTSR